MRATYYKIAAGECLRKQRRKAGLTQEEVGSSLGMSASGWSRVESGETTATVVHLYQFAERVGCEVGEMLGEIHRAVPPLHDLLDESLEFVQALSEFERMLLKAFASRGLPPSNKHRMKAYARAGIARQKLLILTGQIFDGAHT